MATEHLKRWPIALLTRIGIIKDTGNQSVRWLEGDKSLCTVLLLVEENETAAWGKQTGRQLHKELNIDFPGSPIILLLGILPKRNGGTHPQKDIIFIAVSLKTDKNQRNPNSCQ